MYRRSFKDIVAERLVSDLKSALAGQDPVRAGNTVLVVDSFTRHVVNSCLTHTEMLSAGFFAMCPFETSEDLRRGLSRRQYDSLDALYFMRYTEGNMKRLLADFEVSGEAPKADLWERLFPCIFSGLESFVPDPPLYASARTLFPCGPPVTAGVQNWLLAHQYVATSVENDQHRLKRLGSLWQPSPSGVHETPVEFCVLDRNAFSLNLPNTLSTIHQAVDATQLDEAEFDAIEARVEREIDATAHRLVMALVSMNEAPFVRYRACTTDKRAAAAAAVAERVEAKMEEYRAMHPDFHPWGEAVEGRSGSDKAPRKGKKAAAAAAAAAAATAASAAAAHRQHSDKRMEAGILLVLDRLDDLAPALMHGGLRGGELLPFLVDLFDYDPSDALEFRTPEKRGRKAVDYEMLLDDSDPVWRCIRHETYEEVLPRLKRGQGCYNERAAADSEGAADPSSIRDRMLDMVTEEHTCTQKLKLHVQLMNTMVDTMGRGHDVEEAGKLALTLATGLEYPPPGSSSRAAARVYDSKKNAALDRRVREMLASSAVGEEDKARLVAMVLLCYECVEKKLSAELLEALSSDMRRAVEALEVLHVPLTRKTGRSDSAPFLTRENVTRSLEAFSEWWGGGCLWRVQGSAALSPLLSLTHTHTHTPPHPPPTAKTQTATPYTCKAEAYLTSLIEGTELVAGDCPYVAGRAPAARVAGEALPVDPESLRPEEALEAHGEVMLGGWDLQARRDWEAVRAAGGKVGEAKRGFKKEFKKKVGVGMGGGGLEGSFMSGGGGGGGSSSSSSSGTAAAAGAGAAAPGSILDCFPRPPPFPTDGPRLIVFVVGGVTSTEIMAMERLARAKRRDIVIGGSSLLTPKNFLEQLSMLRPDRSEEVESPVRGGGGGGGGGGEEFANLDDMLAN